MQAVDAAHGMELQQTYKLPKMRYKGTPAPQVSPKILSPFGGPLNLRAITPVASA